MRGSSATATRRTSRAARRSPTTFRSRRSGSAPSYSPRSARRWIEAQRLLIGGGNPRDLVEIDRDLTGPGRALKIEDAPRTRVARHRRVTRHHVCVKVRMALAERRGVDAECAGHPLEHALEVAERGAECRRLSI